MLKEGMNGFCMALADSVTGVSGGTVAFIMGFYDRFIGFIHDLAFGEMKEKKSALMYLAKLSVGWVIGIAMAVVVLSTLFENHIYAELEKGHADMKAGRTRSAKSVFVDIRNSHCNLSMITVILTIKPKPNFMSIGFVK